MNTEGVALSRPLFLLNKIFSCGINLLFDFVWLLH
jgi:hypothetical protein